MLLLAAEMKDGQPMKKGQVKTEATQKKDPREE